MKSYKKICLVIFSCLLPAVAVWGSIAFSKNIAENSATFDSQNILPVAQQLASSESNPFLPSPEPSSSPAPPANINDTLRLVAIDPLPENQQVLYQVAQQISQSNYATLNDLSSLESRLLTLIANSQNSSQGYTNQVTYNFAPDQKIDNLNNITVTNGLTISSGGLSVSGNISVSGNLSGAWAGSLISAQYGGTGQNFSASSGLLNFYNGTASSIATSSLGLLTTDIAEGSNLYWTATRFDNRLSATTTLPNLITLLGLTNASTTQLTTTGNTYLASVGGNVGIGTTTPGAKMDVNGNMAINGQINIGSTGAGRTDSDLYIVRNTTDIQGLRIEQLGTGGSRVSLHVTDGGGDAYVGFGVEDAGGVSLDRSWHFGLDNSDSEALWISPGGSVGGPVGLRMDRDSGDLQLRRGTTLGTSASYGFRFTTTSGEDHAQIKATRTDNPGSGASSLTFSTRDATSLKERVIINGSGNVGIGTTTPLALLDLNKANGDSTIHMSATSSSANFDWTYGIDLSDGGKFKISSSSALGTNDRLTINGNGNVGIGTTTPSRVLDISAARGNAIAAGWDVWSSEKYKNNITYLGSQDYSDILAAISNINIATYFYNGEQTCDLNYSNCHKRMGLIAEEAPREVLSASGDSISLYDLASYTLAGVKALGNQMNDLEAKIKDLEGRSFSESLSAVGGDNSSWLAFIGSAIETGLLKFQSLTSRSIVIEKTADPKNDSIGEGMIKAGETESRIESSQIKNNSKIFATFRNDYESRWWISDQGDGFFVVKITQALASDINFDWWVVGVLEPYIGNIDISDSSPSPTPELTESPAPIESPILTEEPAPISETPEPTPSVQPEPETPSPTPTDSPASAPEESPAPVASPTE